MYTLIEAASPDMHRNFQTRALSFIWHRHFLNLAGMHLKFLKVTDSGGISYRKHRHITISQYSHITIYYDASYESITYC